MEDRYIKEDNLIQLAVATNMIKSEGGREFFPSILYHTVPQSLKVYGLFKKNLICPIAIFIGCYFLSQMQSCLGEHF